MAEARMVARSVPGGGQHCRCVADETGAVNDILGGLGQHQRSPAGVSTAANGPDELDEFEWPLAVSAGRHQRPGADRPDFVGPDFGSVSDGVGHFRGDAVQ